MRRLFFPVAAILGVAACNAPPKNDPKAPAEAPAVIDTRPPAPAPVAPSQPKVKIIPDDPTERNIAVEQPYSLAAFTMRNGDIGMLASVYAPTATLKLPDTTVSTNQSIAESLHRFAISKSMAYFQRTSRRLTITDDSTLVDSGTYALMTSRTKGDTITEKGQYIARWRARPSGKNWVMLEDQILPGKIEKKKSGK